MGRENMDVQEEKLVRKTIEELLDLLEIEGDFSLSPVEDGLEMMLETQDSGMVIGYHGEVLESLQLIVSLCVSKKIGRFIRISIEIGDYKRNRTEWLENLARQTKEKAILEKTEVPLPNLRSWERRIVHTFFQDDQEVASESQGIGKDRTLVIRPKEQN